MGLVLVRYVGEIGIKGRNRSLFVRRLRHNLRAALRSKGITGRVWSEGQRIFAEVSQDQSAAALAVLSRVFGVASLSPVTSVSSDIEAIQTEALAVARRALVDASSSFRVSARRADKSFPHGSPDINRLVGSLVQENTGARVDLSDRADLTLGIEVHSESTLVYGETLPGPGGMPLNTQGRVFALLSGGIDSPVAAWLMMRRGCGVIPIHFCQSETEKSKALENCQVLSRWSFGWEIKPIVLDHSQLMAPIVQKLRDIGEERWTCLFCKRAMIAKAAELAPEYRVQALVMGDSLGQVASQTLNNMIAISRGTALPILRPLIAYDKGEIIALARRLGTYEVSTDQSASCPFLPAHPLTSASLDRLTEMLTLLE